MAAWNVLIRDHHAGYITWAQFEENQTMLAGERAYAEARRAQGRARRSGAADRPGALRAVRAHDAGLLRHAIRPRAPLPVPRR